MRAEFSVGGGGDLWCSFYRLSLDALRNFAPRMQRSGAGVGVDGLRVMFLLARLRVVVVREVLWIPLEELCTIKFRLCTKQEVN